MFIKSLTIKKGDGSVIRDIHFHMGLNLIVDETPVVSGKETGNNVGKTTVLKLIDFCLGGSERDIYTNPENIRSEYKVVKDFLIENEIIISLILTDTFFKERSKETVIDRNFLSRNRKICRINGQKKTDKEFDEGLTDLLFPGHFDKKPTFRQIIAHNMRISDLSLTHTIKHLHPFTKDVEYETLYLFLLGCNIEHGDAKERLLTKIDIEEKMLKRLESEQTKPAYESMLNLLLSEIEELENKKKTLNLKSNFESDLSDLNDIKFEISRIAFELSRLEMRQDLILEAQEDIRSNKSNIDIQQLKQIYEQATSLVTGIQKTFSDLQIFHNQMVESKLRFITQDLPLIEEELNKKRNKLNYLRSQEAKLSKSIIGSDSFVNLEQVITELNNKYELKGNYENMLKQFEQIESQLNNYRSALLKIEDKIFAEDFSSILKKQVNKFNKHFATVSNELYAEKYALKVDTKIVKNRRLYEFTPFNINMSSGKKQGEITCFDIAYTRFADEESIPCMHFLLNDKKELMHDNQLVQIANLVKQDNIQFIASILKDKLPPELNRDEYIILRLSQEDKLFRIESNI